MPKKIYVVGHKNPDTDSICSAIAFARLKERLGMKHVFGKVSASELYPTRLRATGQGFCFNFGRLLAATGPLLTGFLVSSLGSYAKAVTAVSLIYIVGIITLLWAKETKGKPLPD